jgi:lipoprotein signal peptidase
MDQVEAATVQAPRRRRTDHERKSGWISVAAIAAVVALTDWGTKAWVASRVPLDEMVVVWEGRVALWHVRNPALILGLFGDLPLAWRKVLAGMLAVAAMTLLFEVISRSHRLLERRRPWAWLFAGLLSGGMLGNLGERALHWWVTDFLSFRFGQIWLPPGNVADLAVLMSIPISFAVIAFELEARSMRRSGKAVAAEIGVGGPPYRSEASGSGAR